MFGLVKVLEDGSEIDLLFIDKSDVEQFVKFVHTYMEESGAGNGCNAYWHYHNDPIIGVDSKIGRGELRVDFIRNMAIAVCDARGARCPKWVDGVYKPPEYIPSYGVVDGTIVFNFDPKKLPPRITPKAGDMVRIVGDGDFKKDTARVKQATEERVILSPSRYSCRFNGEVELPITRVMKIFDMPERK